MQIFKKRPKSFHLIFGVAILASALLVAGSVAALELTQKKRAIVVADCVQAQVTIQTIQYNDAATRVNRGQGYETLLSDFINPLNSRAAAAGFNQEAANLTSVANDFQTQVAKFKNDYDKYDDTVSKVLHTKCQTSPDIFYDQLTKARLQRSTLGSDTRAISQLISQYKTDAAKLKQGAQPL